MPSFRKIRKFNSDVYIYEFNPIKNPSHISLGTKGKFEKLSQIKHDKPGYKELAKINLGFFGGRAEHNGLLIFDDTTQGNPNGDNAECYLDNKGRFFVGQLNAKHITDLKDDVMWACSLSYSLLIDGKENFIGSNRYSHFSQRNPRTLIGQKSNHNIILVVVEGRSNDSVGMTGKQSAQLMKELGCVNAINADGGGSSEMIVNGKVVNEPSDGRERAIGSALIVFGK